MRVFTHFKFIKILLLKCACVKIKTKANSGGAEPDYFKGDDDFLREIKRIVKIPVLRKEYVVDEYMVYEA